MKKHNKKDIIVTLAADVSNCVKGLDLVIKKLETIEKYLDRISNKGISRNELMSVMGVRKQSIKKTA